MYLGCRYDDDPPQLEGIFGTIGKVLGTVASTVTGLPIGGGASSGTCQHDAGWTTSNQYRVDGARWSNKKGYWEFCGQRAPVQSPAPSGSGNQSMSGGPAGAPTSYAESEQFTPGGTPAPSQQYALPPTTTIPVVGQVATTPLVIAGIAGVVLLVLLTQRGRR